MSMVLFDKSECPFCWKVRLALSYKGISFTEKVVDTDNKSEEFLSISPTGKVPVLKTGEHILFESTLILHFLEDSQAKPSLLPGNTASRHLARYLNHYADTVIGPRIRDAIFTQRGKPESQWDKEAIQRSQDNWLLCLEELTPLLRGQYYFCEEPSFAECALIPRFALAEAYNLTGLDGFPKLNDWFDRLKTSKEFQTTAPALCRP